MRDTVPWSPSVVVGIDGSRSGLTAALWAVDEAVNRDIPLRLAYVIDEPGEPRTTDDAAHALAAAEIAVRHAFVAVESTNKPVKIEVEILQGRPSEKLLEASRAATMICIGAVGTKHATTGRLGTTAAALSSRAHCPVAVVRSFDPSPPTPQSIVVEVDKSRDGNAVLQRGVDEALLRRAPLVAVAVWHPCFTDIHDSRAVAEQNRQIRADVNRRLACFVRRHPDLDVRSVAAHGSLLNYLSRHANSTQLVIVGHGRTHGVAEMMGPPSYAALRDTSCSVLICDPQNSL
jgi:nucleotide-binding universal stress UspA family protein